MTHLCMIAGVAAALLASTVLAQTVADGIYPDTIEHPVPTDLSGFKQPDSLVRDMRAIQTGDLKQRLKALLDKSARDQIPVAGGQFMMGDFGPLQSKEKLPWNDNTDTNPLHSVTLDSYSISKYKVTDAELQLYAESNGLPKIGSNLYLQISKPNGSAFALWQNATNYCVWVGKNLAKRGGLPTEAQWEYAARDRGRFILYPTNTGKLEYNVNVPDSALTEAIASVKSSAEKYDVLPIALLPPSPLGLYGMGENGEWTQDWYSADYYASSPGTNPQGPLTGSLKTVRGEPNVDYNTTIHRESREPKGVSGRLGVSFRCVMN